MKTRYAVALIVCLLLSISSAAAETPLKTLHAGLRLFREAASASSPAAAHSLYTEALLRFNRVVRRDGVRNGKIFYDIGNTYYRLDDIGRAILAYRRALLYRPHDPNLEENLAYLRSKRLDRFPTVSPPVVLRILFFWHYALSSPLQLALFLAFFALIWLFLSVRLVIQTCAGRSLLPLWPAGAAAIVAAAFLGSLVWQQIDLSSNRSGVIVANRVVARKGDARSYAPSFKQPLHEGTEFTLLAVRPEWYHIALSNGGDAWIPQSSARLVRPVPGG